MGILKKYVEKFDSMFLPEIKSTDLNLKGYISKVRSGEWRNKIVFGISEKTGGFYSVDPVEQPGAAYIGGMGSGKSVAMKFTIYTHMACNSDNTLYIFFDSEKSMQDYKSAIDDAEKREAGSKINYKYPGVVAALNDVDRFIPLMNMVYLEMLERKKEFTRVGAENISSYERIVGDKSSRFYDPEFKGMARIMFCVEEFHSITSSKNINLIGNVDREGSAAFQFKTLMRTGRSYGINFMVATQRATSDDIPGTIKTGITTWCAFRTNNPGDASMANLPAAADIPSNLRGRCAYEGGFMQFPYMNDAISNKLLSTFAAPMQARLLKFQVSDYRDAAEKEGASAMVDISPLSLIVSSHQQFNPKDVIKRVLNTFDFSVEAQNNTSLVADFIASRGGDKFAVMIVKSRSDMSQKTIQNLERSLPMLDVEKVIAFSFDSMNESVRTLCEKTSGFSVDIDELKRSADVIDSKNKFADKTKYEKLYNELILSQGYQKSPATDAVSTESQAPQERRKSNSASSIEERFAAMKSRYSK